MASDGLQAEAYYSVGGLAQGWDSTGLTTIYNATAVRLGHKMAGLKLQQREEEGLDVEIPD